MIGKSNKQIKSEKISCSDYVRCSVIQNILSLIVHFNMVYVCLKHITRFVFRGKNTCTKEVIRSLLQLSKSSNRVIVMDILEIIE
jgi:hypothetical protein